MTCPPSERTAAAEHTCHSEAQRRAAESYGDAAATAASWEVPARPLQALPAATGNRHQHPLVGILWARKESITLRPHGRNERAALRPQVPPATSVRRPPGNREALPGQAIQFLPEPFPHE